MKNILIVGGAGYVGGYLTDLLTREDNLNIRVYDNLLYEYQYMKEVDFIFGDVRDYSKINDQLKWADIVIWLSAIVGDGACEVDRNLTIDVNLNSVKNLIKSYDRKIIFLSTCSIYGAQDGILIEESEKSPLSLYAETKLLCEQLMSNKNATIFRLGTLFGLGDKFSRIRMDLVLNAIVSKSILENKINIYGGGQYRPLLHVKDVAYGILSSIKKENVNGVFNLHHENIKIIDLAKKVVNRHPNTILNIVDQEFRDTRNYRVNSEKAIKELDFKTKFDIDFGIEEISNLIINNKIKDINDPRYTNAVFLRNKNA